MTPQFGAELAIEAPVELASQAWKTFPANTFRNDSRQIPQSIEQSFGAMNNFQHSVLSSPVELASVAWKTFPGLKISSHQSLCLWYVHIM